MNILKYLSYLAVAGAIVEAIKAAKPGEDVAIPDIKGVRIGKHSYTISGATAVVEA